MSNILSGVITVTHFDTKKPMLTEKSYTLGGVKNLGSQN